MAVKRRKKKAKSKAVEAYEQAMLAEGAPAALDLLGLGSTIGDIIRGKPRKAAKKKRRAKKKTRAKVKMTRTKRTKKTRKTKKNKKTKTKKKSARRTSRRRK